MIPWRVGASLVVILLSTLGLMEPDRWAAADACAQQAAKPGIDRAGDPLPAGAVARLGTLRLRHSGPGPALALSPDGKLLASGGIDKHIRLWDATTGQEVRRWDAGQGALGRLLFSPNGTVLAAAGADNAIRLWNLERGSQQLRLEGDAVGVVYMAFSRDGRGLLASDRSGTARLWEVASGKVRRRWQIFKGKDIRRIGGHSEFQFVTLAASPDLRTLAWGTWRVEPVPGKSLLRYRGEVILWDAETSTERCRLVGEEVRPESLTFSADGRTLAARLDSGPVGLWDSVTGKLRRRLAGSWAEGERLLFSPDGRVLAFYGGNFVSLWDPSTGTKLGRLGPGPDNRPDPFGLGVTLSADSKTLALRAYSRITLWNVPTRRPTVRLPGHQRAIDSVRFARDGKTLATLAGREIRLWDTAAWKETHLLERPLPEQPLAAFSANGRWLSYKTDGDSVRFLELPSAKPLPRFRPDDFAFWSYPWSPDGKTVAVVRDDRRLCLYDAAAGQGLNWLETKAFPLRPPAFSPDGKLLVWVNSGVTVTVAETATARQVHHLGKGYPKIQASLIARGVYSAAFTPDGKALAAGGEYDNIIRLWDVKTGKPFREFIGHRGPIAMVTFSPDGRLLASLGNWENEIRLWDVATGAQRRHFRGHEDRPTDLAFSPDGRSLVSSSLDGTALVWDVSKAAARAATPE
jgi:WD40 repeat protein